MIDWEALPYFEINLATGAIMTFSLLALGILLWVLAPRRLMDHLVLWFMLTTGATMLRWIAAGVWPQLFSSKESLIDSVFFIIATAVTVALMVVAWREHFGQYRKNRRGRINGRMK